ncbi:hypothetical protein ACFVVQ_06110 [Paenibacillus chitinolyticus]|uniref:hypothetical protein n=1 Tax=Paenibacillus chitinolyticus TaxID=79263 RepID=UPI0036DC265F
MNTKIIFGASLALLIALGVFPAAPGVQAKDNSLSSINELRSLAVNPDHKVNILLYNEGGKIDREFHSDGLEVTYTYEKNGNMQESADNKGGKQKYVDKGNFVEVVEYQNGIEKSRRNLSEKNKKAKIRPLTEQLLEEKSKIDNWKKNESLGFTDQSLTQYEDYKVNNILLNDLVPKSCPCKSGSDPFINFESLKQTEIQSFFEAKNSILKDAVQIWRKKADGSVIEIDKTVLPSEAIYNAAVKSRMNPKVVIASLQKESSLISAQPDSVSSSSRRFYYALGYGATDGGDLLGTSGFDVQIEKGTQLFKDLWFEAPSTNYPVLVKEINYNKTVTSNGVIYKNYIWVKNYGTWAMYKYTPHAIDSKLLPTVGGGNYLFYQVFKGYWGTDWN